MLLCMPNYEDWVYKKTATYYNDMQIDTLVMMLTDSRELTM